MCFTIIMLTKILIQVYKHILRGVHPYTLYNVYIFYQFKSQKPFIYRYINGFKKSGNPSIKLYSFIIH